MKSAPLRPPLVFTTATQSVSASLRVIAAPPTEPRLTAAELARVGWKRVVFEPTRTIFVWADE